MTLVREVADLIKLLGEVIKNTREIVTTVNDGRKFLAARYPEARGDFASLLTQMHQAIAGLAKVTRVIGGFRFVVDERLEQSDTGARELARFNDYVMQQHSDVNALRNDIRNLKANCERVRELRDKLDAQSKDRSWGAMFGLLGENGRQRSVELASSMSNFYADDQRMIELVEKTLQLAEQAIDDVEDTLGPRGMTSPYNIPAAAQVLHTYAVLFDQPEKDLHALADSLSLAAAALQPPREAAPPTGR